MYLVAAPAADDRRREVLRHVAHRRPHLRDKNTTAKGEERRQSRLNRTLLFGPAMEDARTTPHRVGHVGGVGVGDDGRERPVVVEEHDDLFPLGRAGNLLELPERRRVLPLLKSAERPGKRLMT
jgi:hypothetical protein